MKQKENKILLLIFVLLILIVIVLFSIGNEKKDQIKEDNKIILLKDYSRFYTVNSCIYKYVVNIASKNTDNILKILDKEYINENSINKDNLYNYVEDIKGNYTFESKKMYYEKINDNYYKYYVYGQILEDTINGVSNNGIEAYYTLNLDINNKTFSISPYKGNVFKEDSNE